MTNDELLRKKIRAILLREWDPLGVKAFKDAEDTYDGYADELADLLLGDATKEEVHEYLWDLETVTLKAKGDKRTAERVVDLLMKLAHALIPKNTFIDRSL